MSLLEALLNNYTSIKVKRRYQDWNVCIMNVWHCKRSRFQLKLYRARNISLYWAQQQAHKKIIALHV